MLLVVTTKDALAPATTDQLAAEDSAFERFAQAHRIGDQQPLAWHRQCLRCWLQLIVERVHRSPITHRQGCIGGDGAAQVRLNEQQAVAVLRRGIGNQFSGFWLQHLEAAGRLFHLNQEASLFFPQERRDPHHIHHLLAIAAAAEAAHQPFGTAALDAGSRGEDGFGHGNA